MCGLLRFEGRQHHLTAVVKTGPGRVIELPSKSEWAAYLREACGDDAWLRHNVEELLRGRFAADNSITPQQAVDPIPPGFVMRDL